MLSDSFFSILNFKKIRPFANRISHQTENLFKLSIKLNGIRLYANSIDRILALIFWKWSILEGFEAEYIIKKIEKNWAVIDIGANIGFYTVQFSKKVGKTGKVIAVEPAKNNIYLLKKTIRKNQLKNVFLISKAVSSNSEMGKLYVSDGHSGDHRIYNTTSNRKSISIKTITIDALTKNEERVDLIKMDIQGAEHFAIKGIQETLKRFPNIIIVTEFSPQMLIESGGNPENFLDFFIDNDFLIKFFNEKRKQLLFATKKELLEKICINSKYVSLYLQRTN